LLILNIDFSLERENTYIVPYQYCITHALQAAFYPPPYANFLNSPFQRAGVSGKMHLMVESSGTSPKLDLRVEDARLWISDAFTEVSLDWFAVAGDASNRRYFRGYVDGQTRILMDSPPALENPATFVDICGRLRSAGLHAPEIIMHDLERGFLLLEDLGDELFRDLLDESTSGVLFDEAFAALAVMAGELDTTGLPVFDEDRLYDELNLFPDLYLIRHLDFRLPHRQRLAWRTFCDELVTAALEQPRVFVHRDVHSCNLIRTPENSPGIIDFQDAVAGPLTYDFASLIWDRYIHWPREQLEQWMEQFRQMVAPDTGAEQWVYWCDLMGLQRNLRIVGRFAQLQYSAGKPGYIEMIPAFYRHILEVLPRYPQFAPITEWIGSEKCAP
jgi:aminoglycoside/choline kinase family phosphotransferase